MSLWMIPFVVFWAAVEWLGETLSALAPFIGVTIAVVCAIAAVLSVIVVVVVARRLLPSPRRWLRVLAVLLIVAEVAATAAFTGVAVIAALAVAVYA